jgi:hypothetical protein
MLDWRVGVVRRRDEVVRSSLLVRHGAGTGEGEDLLCIRGSEAGAEAYKNETGETAAHLGSALS